jgi:hypothetical protein
VVPSDLTPRYRLQVWSAGRSQVLHAVRLERDTLSGVPYWQAPECDSCRVALPSEQVDSIRVRAFSRKNTLILVLFMIPMTIIGNGMKGLQGA